MGRGHRGVATVEFQIVALFALLPLCLGTLQMALLMSENHHVDFAAFAAARRASMAQGDLGVARRAFAQAAVPLMVSAPDEVDEDNVAARVAEAYVKTLADVTLHASFRVLNPGAEAQQDFVIQRGENRVIPNDAMEYRSADVGERSGLTIQQANILRLEVTWCRPLVVPFVRELLVGFLRRIDLDPSSQRCYLQGRIPIRSEGVTPMQSDFKVSS